MDGRLQRYPSESGNGARDKQMVAPNVFILGSWSLWMEQPPWVFWQCMSTVGFLQRTWLCVWIAKGKKMKKEQVFFFFWVGGSPVVTVVNCEMNSFAIALIWCVKYLDLRSRNRTENKRAFLGCSLNIKEILKYFVWVDQSNTRTTSFLLPLIRISFWLIKKSS